MRLLLRPPEQLGSADNPIVITFVPSGDTGKITKAGTAIADCLAGLTGPGLQDGSGHELCRLHRGHGR